MPSNIISHLPHEVPQQGQTGNHRFRHQQRKFIRDLIFAMCVYTRRNLDSHDTTTDESNVLHETLVQVYVRFARFGNDLVPFSSEKDDEKHPSLSDFPFLLPHLVALWEKKNYDLSSIHKIFKLGHTNSIAIEEPNDFDYDRALALSDGWPDDSFIFPNNNDG